MSWRRVCREFHAVNISGAGTRKIPGWRIQKEKPE